MNDLIDKFAQRVDVSDGCWIWTADTNVYGYGRFSLGKAGSRVYAHRWAYEALVEPIPEGLHIDHLCRVRACVNPDHLEVVTQSVNSRRTRRAYCTAGHEWTPENTYVTKSGRRQCRACKNIRQARYYRFRKDSTELADGCPGHPLAAVQDTGNQLSGLIPA